MPDAELDRVGLWTEVKLDILREYSKAYARILNKQPAIRHYAYVDGFAGEGTHISKTSSQEIDGSLSIALLPQPQFSHYHFIALDGKGPEQGSGYRVSEAGQRGRRFQVCA